MFEDRPQGLRGMDKKVIGKIRMLTLALDGVEGV
jgi:hypothetical protein